MAVRWDLVDAQLAALVSDLTSALHASLRVAPGVSRSMTGATAGNAVPSLAVDQTPLATENRSPPFVHALLSLAVDRFHADALAARFHLSSTALAPRRARSRAEHRPTLVVVLGGTGTGKSTLVNRLLDSESAPLTASSFRRTYTAGPVAVAHSADPASVPSLPAGWLDLDHVVVDRDSLPARGQGDSLSVAPHQHELLRSITLIDTPDLDGDQPAHHAQADRAFRWAEAVLFLVTPEKYQMTELLPYYRLVTRYALPAVFVMNKSEEQAVVDDYSGILRGSGFRVPGPERTRVSDAAGDVSESNSLFAVPRDDSTYVPPPGMDLGGLRRALERLGAGAEGDESARHRGMANRVSDLVARLRDQILEPLRADRRSIEGVVRSLRAMESPAADVDVNPLMVQLRRRLQQRSVLYLMGPGRMVDRVRQVPGLLARLPRATWDLVRHGSLNGETNGAPTAPPADVEARRDDFHGALSDQFRVLQARIDDLLRGAARQSSIGAWLDDPGCGFAAEVMIDPAEAGRIADEELVALKEWLEKRWNATPRDTAVLAKLIKHIPGGEKLTQWSEAAPYVLAAVVATHHAFFGPIDLMVIGGFSLATWVTERLSNEVAGRARDANRRIAQRFAELSHRQISRTCAWLEARVPTARVLDNLERRADELSEQVSAVR